MSGLSLPQGLEQSLQSTKVDYVQLGSSGLRVSWPILGAMGFASSPIVPWCLGEEAAFKVLKAAYDIGINTWDTSNVYSNGGSEEVLGKFLRTFGIPRYKVVIMTKCAFAVGEEPTAMGHAFGEQMGRSKDYVNQGGLSRVAIFKAVDDSLARLGASYIDLLQIHRYDPTVPPEEIMKALHDLVQSGKVRYIGASSMWATKFAQLQYLAEKNHWTKFISMQNYYNLCYREEEREMIRFCKETGVGLIPYAPLLAGRLARPVGQGTSQRSKGPYAHTRGLGPVDEQIIGRVEDVAAKKGWKMAEVALAWQKSKGTIPIVGLNSVERVEEIRNLQGKVLTDEDVKYLEELYEAKPVTGHS
ncbi:Aldo/keto reductase [Microthyrium microscopicum]|uniref:Aldo/keto reductase n=1 Tax=Microthyrium microscopicum TaxID=703497 RepID=A0A6A6UH35_9PEZI|nr:Aldo/keto reductase [Microthyrium microscopicum]